MESALTVLTQTVGDAAAPTRHAAGGLIALFGAAGFLGALLLFTIEPLAAKALLPVLGGSPAVWNTAMAFFQVALLAGYLTAHLTNTRLPLRWRLPVQLIILAFPLWMLPFGLPDRRPSLESPVFWELGALAVMVGAPFFALATLSPTVQAWFSRTTHPRARDPFFLYAASNVGSFLGLLAYPLVIEPRLDLVDQAKWFRWGYLLLVVVATGAAWRARRGHVATQTSPVGRPPIDMLRKLFWVSAAAIPSLMLLAVSRHIATDVASFPLLWVVPLALYLATFVLAFSKFSSPVTSGAGLLFPFLAIPAAVAWSGVLTNIWLGLGLPLALLVASGLLAHGRLYQDRPPASRLTEFYLWISVGGAVGGLLGALVAPVVFDVIAEYPIAIVATALLMVGQIRPGRRPLKLVMGVLYVGSLAIALIASDVKAVSLLLGLAGVAAYGIVSASRWLALALAGLLAIGTLYTDGRLLSQERTFFGVYRVVENSEGDHLMVSGTTVHGAQHFRPQPRPIPLTYYVSDGPVGQVMRTVGSTTDHIGIIGLGAGALASYLVARQTLTYYEIDPAVIGLATDPKLFTYTRDTAGRVEYVVGDGRLTLERPHAPFGLLIIDAFSSDAIPTHLLTLEATRAYLDALEPGGVIGFHISNRHLDLEPVVGRIASELDLVARINHFQPTNADGSPTTFVVMARSVNDLGPLASDGSWVEPQIGMDLWTDTFTDLLGVIRWG
jgi:hypothetical protein